jgi:hypothetical protein
MCFLFTMLDIQDGQAASLTLRRHLRPSETQILIGYSKPASSPAAKPGSSSSQAAQAALGSQALEAKHWKPSIGSQALEAKHWKPSIPPAPLNPAGGARRDRTDDLMLAKHALSQLSYGPVRGQASEVSNQKSDRIPDLCHLIPEHGGPRRT